jgi:hypothetical protein
VSAPASARYTAAPFFAPPTVARREVPPDRGPRSMAVIKQDDLIQSVADALQYIS